MKKYSGFQYIRFILRIVVLSLFLLSMTGCSKNSSVPQTKARIKLGAYYFDGWAGKCPSDDGSSQNAWAKGMPTHFTKKLATDYSGRMPIWGWRDDSYPVMEQQIDLAADHGIAYFSFCWYWADNKGPINVPAIESDSKQTSMFKFMNSQNNKRMEFCLLVANHTGSEIIGEAAWRQAADYWITLFKHPRYLRTDGKPVLMIFSPSGSNLAGLDYLQDAARKAGFPGVAITGCGTPTLADGYLMTTRYNIIPGSGQPSEMHQYHELVDANVAQWHGTPSQPQIPVATVGWDRRPWEAPDGYGSGSPPSWYFTGNTPDAVGNFIRTMADWMDANPTQVTKDKLAIIYAWNELGEGGYVVPCADDPNGAYLDAIKNVVLSK